MNSVETTSADCQCPIPPEGTEWFWCDSHQCRKSVHLQKLCATNPSARLGWEQGKGPGQGVAIPTPGTPIKIKPVASGKWSWSILKRFTTALVKHAGDWFRKCSRKEIQTRLEICKQCEHFTGTACAQCGCRVNLETRFLNKLAWRSESCPLGKWPSLSHRRWSWKTSGRQAKPFPISSKSQNHKS